MSKKVNKGNIVTGGVQYVGNQAIGDNATANWHTADVTRLLAHVETVLTAHEDRLPAAARAEFDDLEQELIAEHPRPSVVKRALDGLATFAKPVAPLVSAVADLAKAVHGG